jgi:hypothetical protein
VLQANDGDRILAAVQPPKPPEPPPPPQPKQHWEEEAAWLQGQDPPVLPQDNDMAHIQGHMAFMASPPAQTMAKEQREKAEQHLRNHWAQAILKQGSASQGMPGPQMQPPGMPQGGPPPGPGGPPGGGPPPGGPPPGPPMNGAPGGPPPPQQGAPPNG